MKNEKIERLEPCFCPCYYWDHICGLCKKYSEVVNDCFPCPINKHHKNWEIHKFFCKHYITRENYEKEKLTTGHFK
ncbi:MAG: hypothetical protein WC877_01250 [Dehalococcoidales bacterium]|jgi:hypothetical protein